MFYSIYTTRQTMCKSKTAAAYITIKWKPFKINKMPQKIKYKSNNSERKEDEAVLKKKTYLRLNTFLWFCSAWVVTTEVGSTQSLWMICHSELYTGMLMSWHVTVVTNVWAQCHISYYRVTDIPKNIYSPLDTACLHALHFKFSGLDRSNVSLDVEQFLHL